MSQPLDEYPIAVVDDDQAYAEGIAYQLAELGWHCQVFTDPSDFLENGAQNFSGLLLDLDMPTFDGLAVLKQVEGHPDLFKILVSCEDAQDKKLATLRAGAHFYLVKPTSASELNLILRNSLLNEVTQKSRWQLDERKLALVSPKGSVHSLTHAEARVLKRLLASAPDTVSRQAILEDMGRPNTAAQSRAADILLSRLRRRLLDEGCEIPVRSVRAQGYAFVG